MKSYVLPIKSDVSVPQGIQRIVREQLERAVKKLTNAKLQPQLRILGQPLGRRLSFAPMLIPPYCDA